MDAPPMEHLPVFLQMQERAAVVIGGGLMATRKTELLLRCGARVTVVSPSIHDELRDLLARLSPEGRLRHVEGHFEPAHLDGAAIVVAATDSRTVNAAVAAAARERNAPVNVVDDPALSTFIVPAIIDRSPVIVAVGSGGRSPVLARKLRTQLEGLLPSRLGALAKFAGERRQRVREALRPEQRRPFWERILGGTVGTRVLDGDTELADAAFTRELQSFRGATPGSTGEVYLIGAGPGDPELLTLRAVQLLQQADVVLYDRLVSAAVLDRARRDAERVSVGKAKGEREMTQERINELLVHYARRGKRVARLKGGDPFIFGRGGEEIEALAAHGIPFTVVPGITAGVGAGASTGIPLTHRGVAQSVTLTTGHFAAEDAQDWHALARPNHTVVFYMGVSQLETVATKLIGAGAPESRPVAIVERATQADQRVIRGTLGSIASIARESAVVAPAVLIIGDVAGIAAAIPTVTSGSTERSVA